MLPILEFPEPPDAPPPARRLYDGFKTTADTVIALILFAVSLPILVLAGLLVKLTSRGPATYCQVRVGRDGRPFTIYKLRSMYHNCEKESGARWSAPGDRRITPVGHVLRKTHIDELPQLWNVLRGDMSLIGPRPERPEFVRVLERTILGYRGRLAVKPGVTGLAQIQLPPDTDIESVREKLALDLCYVERYGPLLDARILAGTVLYLLGVPYGAVRRALALPAAQPAVVLVPQAVPELA
jgi:lipopolysaccharide/colanic/teichoic acid biosynthesis glycosyltransferase